MIYFLALIKFILPYLLQNKCYQLHRDELLYLADGQHLSWGFMEMPPLLSVFSFLSHMFGANMFVVKLWPSLFGALTYILTSKIVVLLGGRYFAIFINFLAMTFGAFLSTHFLFQPNALEVLFATVIAYSAIRFIQTGNNIWLYVCGVAFGLGMLSKSSIAFFMFSISCSLLFSSQWRILQNKHFYLAIFAGVLIFLPNLLWEYNHKFPVLYHLYELQQEQLARIKPVDFLKGQIILNLPAFFIWIAGLLFVLLDRRGKSYRLFFWAFCILMLILLLLHGKDYYGLVIYPVLFAFGSFYLESLTIQKIYVRIAMIVIILCLSIVDLPMELPILAPPQLARFYKKYHYERFDILQWEDGKDHSLKQDFADMLGWQEIAQKTTAAFKSLPFGEKEKTLIYCSNYGICGAVNYYAPKESIPEPYSDNASFLIWMPKKMNFQNVLFIGHSFPAGWESGFSEIKILDQLNSSARESGLQIVLFKNASNECKRLFEKKISDKKNKFSF